MYTVIKDQIRGDERAFYGMRDTAFVNCRISGEEDGESAFKECGNISLDRCTMSLRYPLWHLDVGEINDCSFSESCRAPLWYCRNVILKGCELSGVKAVRECEGITFEGSRAVSTEFGWKTKGFSARESYIEGEYLFFDSADVTLDRVAIKGKYSFQYVKNAVVRNCVLDTKDAFWHAENVTVYDSVVNGEYLGWYSKGLKLVRCKISGTQPLCYAEGLVLEDCTMTGCDLSFERSSVEATVIGSIHSVKNPEGGNISAENVGEIVSDDGRERKTVLVLGDGTRHII